MCPELAWWQIGAGWGVATTAFLVGAALAGPLCWYAHSARQWWRRTKIHLQFLRPFIKWVLTAAATLTVGVVVAWSWATG
jgi:hypothetical protein